MSIPRLVEVFKSRRIFLEAQGYTSYEDAATAEISKEDARREIEKHDSDGGFQQFLKDVGDKPKYKGSEILDWLGY